MRSHRFEKLVQDVGDIPVTVLASSKLPDPGGHLLRLTCTGTKRYPGCQAQFLGPSHKQKFCPTCAGLDRPSSYVFVERRLALAALEPQEED